MLYKFIFSVLTTTGFLAASVSHAAEVVECSAGSGLYQLKIELMDDVVDEISLSTKVTLGTALSDKKIAFSCIRPVAYPNVSGVMIYCEGLVEGVETQSMYLLSPDRRSVKMIGFGAAAGDIQSLDLDCGSVQ